MPRGLMLYDADCGFCARTAALVPRLGVDVTIASLQETDLAAHGIDAGRAVREMPFVSAGEVAYGHLAWAGVLRTAPPPARWLGTLLATRVCSPVAARVYRWVSEHRSRLPGGTPACAVGKEPAERSAGRPAGTGQPVQASFHPSTAEAGRDPGPA